MFLFLTQLTLLAAVAAARRGGVAFGAILGMLLAAGVLTRHVGVSLAGAVAIEILLRRHWRNAVAAGLTSGAVVLPWAGWLAVARTPNQVSLLALNEESFAGRVSALALFYVQRLPDQLTGPIVEIGTVFQNRMWVAGAVNAWAVVATGVLAFGLVRTLCGARRRLAGLTLFGTLAVLLVWPFTEAGRFLIPLVPCLLVGAVDGLAPLFARCPFRRSRVWAASAVLVVSLPYSVYSIVAARADAQRRTYRDFDAACAWIAQQTGRSGPILARHPAEVFWLSGRRSLSPSSDEPATIDALIDQFEIAYLLIDEDRYANAQVSPLAGYVARRPSRVRAVWKSGSGRASVVVYEVRTFSGQAIVPIYGEPRHNETMMPPLTSSQEEKLGEIQRKVRAMVGEKQSSVQDNARQRPSHYWADFTSFFDYMGDLSPRSLAKLRLHTYHLTSDNYQTYYFENRRAFFDFYGPWLATDGLPAEHILSEPEDGIGFRLEDGRFVSADIARFQRSVATLSRQGILDELTRSAISPRIIEIGGGYGGLALHLSEILKTCRYFIVDLPETLLFSASYLVLQAPAKRLYLYEPGDRFDAEALAGFDFLLLPDYRLDALTGFDFDLAINIASMQEMRVDQIEWYLDFIRRSCRGVFYSCNRDRQNRNDELPSLFELMRSRFALTEVRAPAPPPPPLKVRARRRLKRSLRRVAQAIGLVEAGNEGPTVEPFPTVEHLCHARSRDSQELPQKSN